MTIHRAASGPKDNKAFLDLYNRIPETEQARIERYIWAEINFVDPAAAAVHRIGYHYIQNLTWPSYMKLTEGLRSTLVSALWVAHGDLAADTLLVRAFLEVSLPQK